MPPTWRRPRRVAAAALALAGLVDLLSALTPPLHGRLLSVLDVVPLLVPRTAAALVALLALALLLLTRGILRGQRRAWAAALGVLFVSAVLHLVKGVDVEEALASAATAGYLVRHRAAFGTPADRPSLLRGIAGLVVATSIVLVVAVTAIESFTHPRLAVSVGSPGTELEFAL